MDGTVDFASRVDNKHFTRDILVGILDEMDGTYDMIEYLCQTIYLLLKYQST